MGRACRERGREWEGGFYFLGHCLRPLEEKLGCGGSLHEVGSACWVVHVELRRKWEVGFYLLDRCWRLKKVGCVGLLREATKDSVSVGLSLLLTEGGSPGDLTTQASQVTSPRECLPSAWRGVGRLEWSLRAPFVQE